MPEFPFCILESSLLMFPEHIKLLSFSIHKHNLLQYKDLLPDSILTFQQITLYQLQLFLLMLNSQILQPSTKINKTLQKQSVRLKLSNRSLVRLYTVTNALLNEPFYQEIHCEVFSCIDLTVVFEVEEFS